MLISSDSHVSPQDGRVPSLHRAVVIWSGLTRFLNEYKNVGSRNFESPALRLRLDPDEIERWDREIADPGRLEGAGNSLARLSEMAREGVAAEVLFPDFGRPFEMYSASMSAIIGFAPDPDEMAAGNRAFNRWLADFVSVAPHRFAPMALLTDWNDIDSSLREIDEFVHVGFRGVVPPSFSRDVPLYHPCFEPIWSAIEASGLVANCHSGMSSTSERMANLAAAGHPGAAIRILNDEVYFHANNVLSHLIWGGVLQRHPNLKVIFTEQGSGWVISALASMDYSYFGSYLRRDTRDVVPLPPSEYYHRQCFVGASTFSRAEVGARAHIGLNKMMLGMDYPHHEGTFTGGTLEYLRATLGAEQVPEAEARLLLGETAAGVFGFDTGRLSPIANEIGPSVRRRADPAIRRSLPQR